jgi:hypothetical protein
MDGTDITGETRRRVTTKGAPRRWHTLASDETSYARSQTPGE